MATGTIKTLVFNKGFGFITPDEGGAQGSDLFFHQSAVESPGFDQLQEGEKVSYTDEPDPRNAGRRRAVNVTLVQS